MNGYSAGFQRATDSIGMFLIHRLQAMDSHIVSEAPVFKYLPPVASGNKTQAAVFFIDGLQGQPNAQ